MKKLFLLLLSVPLFSFECAKTQTQTLSTTFNNGALSPAAVIFQTGFETNDPNIAYIRSVRDQKVPGSGFGLNGNWHAFYSQWGRPEGNPGFEVPHDFVLQTTATYALNGTVSASAVYNPRQGYQPNWGNSWIKIQAVSGNTVIDIATQQINPPVFPGRDVRNNQHVLTVSGSANVPAGNYIIRVVATTDQPQGGLMFVDDITVSN